MRDGALRRRFGELRATDFFRLDEGGHAYLDYTGSGLYAESQLRAHEASLEHHLLGNPHSENPASLAAAAYVPTNRLDLSVVQPDFACVSFYKMFGFPTGVGALLARREALSELNRELLDILSGATHRGGAPLVEIYGPRSPEARGGTAAFNVLDAGGGVVPYGVVEREASEEGISLRGGCFCNPGVAEVAFGLPAGRMAECFQSTDRGGFTLPGLAECLDYAVPVGALRASVGIATNGADLERLRRFLEALASRQPPLAAPSAASS